MTHYHAYSNTAGYVPESDDSGYPFATFAEARDSLADDMARAAEDSAEFDPQRAADLDAIMPDLRALPAEAEGWLGYTATHGDSDHDIPTAWQVVACTHAECAQVAED
jgi:hypothetical protein